MSNPNILTDKQMDVVNALTEWRDAGGPVEDVVLTIQQMILSDLKYVFADFGTKARRG